MSNDKKTIHLGFEVGTGEPVAVPLKHMAVTGQTQEAGKTTALEAMIARSGLRALAFVTKRGEGSFGDARRIPPYFRERADWVFVSSLIDATMGEKNKLIRSWLMRTCRNTQTLADVLENVRTAKDSAKGFAESIYTEIEGYLDLVVPQIAELPPATSIDLEPGINVMDLSAYSSEVQSLVIRSALDWTYENERDVVTIIPEAWEFIPENRGSPAKAGFEQLVRKGGNLNNRLWIDSQDMAGVWKLALRASAVWLIGVQREANEIKRTLTNIPAGTAKPTAAQIAQLGLGEFYACFGKSVIRTYVQPAWMNEETARGVARGEIDVALARPRATQSITPKPVPEKVWKIQTLNAPTLRPGDKIEVKVTKQEQPMSSSVEQKLDAIISIMSKTAATPTAPLESTFAPIPGNFDEESLYQRFKSRLLSEPAVLAILKTEPILNVTVEKSTVNADGSTLLGRIALLISRGWMDETRTNSAIVKELGRTGGQTIAPRVSEALTKLKTMGFVTDEGEGWQAVKPMKRDIIIKSSK